MFRKVSVFVLVVAFHLVVLGVVYLSTREPSNTPSEESVESDSASQNSENVSVDSPDNSSAKEQVKTSPAKPPKTDINNNLKVHVVEKGDYLGKIAAKYKVSSKEIMTLNNISNPNKIHLGQKIKIPAK